MCRWTVTFPKFVGCSFVRIRHKNDCRLHTGRVRAYAHRQQHGLAHVLCTGSVHWDARFPTCVDLQPIVRGCLHTDPTRECNQRMRRNSDKNVQYLTQPGVDLTLCKRVYHCTLQWIRQVRSRVAWLAHYWEQMRLPIVCRSKSPMNICGSEAVTCSSVWTSWRRKLNPQCSWNLQTGMIKIHARLHTISDCCSIVPAISLHHVEMFQMFIRTCSTQVSGHMSPCTALWCTLFKVHWVLGTNNTETVLLLRFARIRDWVCIAYRSIQTHMFFVVLHRCFARGDDDAKFMKQRTKDRSRLIKIFAKVVGLTLLYCEITFFWIQIVNMSSVLRLYLMSCHACCGFSKR